MGLVLPVSEYSPDSPDFVGSGADTIKNCLPRTAQSYGPMPSLNAYSPAITARCQGAIGVADASGNSYAFAGDATNLYKAAGGSTAWSTVTRAVGGAYSTASDQRWSGAFYDPSRVLMTNFSDPIQSFVIGSSTAFADLSAAAPKCRYLGVIKDFLIAGNTFDGTDGARPARVWWSAIGDPTNWPTPGTAGAQAVQSDFQDIPGFGAVQGIVGGLGNADGAIFLERGIVRVGYVGGTTVFAFDVAEGARGTPAPGSIAQLGSIVYYLGEDGFYAFDGAQSAPIGHAKVDKTFFDDLDQSYFYRISSAVDPISKTVFWAYPGVGNAGGNPNRLLAYNWALQRWSLIDGLGDVELIFRSLSFGYSLDQLDSVSASIDALPFSLDSRAWTGGRILLSAFDSSHRLNYFTGAALAPTVDTQELQPTPGKRTFVGSVRPIVEGTSAVTPSVAIGVRERTVDAVTWQTASSLNAIGECEQRASGRYVRARTTLPAGSSFTHISGIELTEFSPDGER
jgi:hypothetical protein